MTRVLLAWLTSGTVSSHFCGSLAGIYKNPLLNVAIDDVRVQGGPLVAHQRNLAAKHFLETNNDLLLFVDSDMKFEPNDILDLIDSDKDIVGAQYYGYSEERDEKFPTWDSVIDYEWNKPGLIECNYVGTGFMMIRRKVFEKLGVCLETEWPFGSMPLDGKIAIEDVTFCHRAR